MPKSPEGRMRPKRQDVPLEQPPWTNGHKWTMGFGKLVVSCAYCGCVDLSKEALVICSNPGTQEFQR